MTGYLGTHWSKLSQRISWNFKIKLAWKSSKLLKVFILMNSSKNWPLSRYNGYVLASQLENPDLFLVRLFFISTKYCFIFAVFQLYNNLLNVQIAWSFSNGTSSIRTRNLKNVKQTSFPLTRHRYDQISIFSFFKE